MAVADLSVESGSRTMFSAGRDSTRFVTCAAALITAVLSAAFIARTAFSYHGQTYFSLFDDSMISMTYARNLADGHGLVWNPGGEHVEGYTNLLWTLWMALIHVVGIPDRMTSLVVMVTGVGLLIGNLFVIAAIGRRLAPDAPRVAQLAVLLTALLYPLLFWTLRGMEVGLLTVLVSLAVLLALRIAETRRGRDAALLAAVLAAGVLTRDDSVTWAAVVVVFLAWHWRAAALWAAGTVVAVVVAKTGFRAVYYDEILPNTYTLKLGGIALSDRLPRGVVALVNSAAVQLYAPAALAVVAFMGRGARRASLLLLAGIFAVQCAYSVYVGGDVWEFFQFSNRYLTPAIPLLLVLASVGLHTLVSQPQHRRRNLLLLAGLFALVACLNLALTTWRGEHEIARLAAIPGRDATIWIAAAAALATALVAVGRRLSDRAAFALIGAVLLLATTGQNLGHWTTDNAEFEHEDAEMSRYGLLLGELTPRDASVAVAWAGAIPYFSHRDGVDLLGKSDRFVAQTAPLAGGVFNPGHNKFNYAYSLGQLRPTVIAQLAQLGSHDWPLLRSLDYRYVVNYYPPGGAWAQIYLAPSVPARVGDELRRRLVEITRDT